MHKTLLSIAAHLCEWLELYYFSEPGQAIRDGPLHRTVRETRQTGVISWCGRCAWELGNVVSISGCEGRRIDRRCTRAADAPGEEEDQIIEGYVRAETKSQRANRGTVEWTYRSINWFSATIWDDSAQVRVSSLNSQWQCWSDQLCALVKGESDLRTVKLSPNSSHPLHSF